MYAYLVVLSPPENIKDDIAKIKKQLISGKDFKMYKISGMEDFQASIKKQRAKYLAVENELYSKWRQGQYMYSMFSTQHSELSDMRYKKFNIDNKRGIFKVFYK